MHRMLLAYEKGAHSDKRKFTMSLMQIKKTCKQILNFVYEIRAYI